jgi:hypothetical protein
MIKPSDLVHEVLEQGTRTALSARVLLKRMEEDIEIAKEAIREQAVREVTEQGKECQVDGATITLFTGRKTYDYKMLPAIIAAEKNLTEQKRLHQMAAIKKFERGEDFITDDGEVVAPCGMKTGHDNVTIKL